MFFNCRLLRLKRRMRRRRTLRKATPKKKEGYVGHHSSFPHCILMFSCSTLRKKAPTLRRKRYPHHASSLLLHPAIFSFILFLSSFSLFSSLSLLILSFSLSLIFFSFSLTFSLFSLILSYLFMLSHPSPLFSHSLILSYPHSLSSLSSFSHSLAHSSPLPQGGYYEEGAEEEG